MLRLLHTVWKKFPTERLLQLWNRAAFSGAASFLSGTTFHRGSSVINMQADKQCIEIGENSHIRGELLVFAHGGKITIGNYCYVGEGSKIWSAKNIVIGNYVLIAHGVNIHDNVSHPIDAKQRRKHTEEIIHQGHPHSGIDLKEKEIIINDDAWIGFNATVLRGVSIGKGAIVGACSVVTENVPDFAIVVGNPARIIGYANNQA